MKSGVFDVDPVATRGRPASRSGVSAASEMRKLRSRMKRRADSLLSDAALAEELGEAELADTLLAASLLAESAGRSERSRVKPARRKRELVEQARPVVVRRPANPPMKSLRHVGTERWGRRLPRPRDGAFVTNLTSVLAAGSSGTTSQLRRSSYVVYQMESPQFPGISGLVRRAAQLSWSRAIAECGAWLASSYGVTLHGIGSWTGEGKTAFLHTLFGIVVNGRSGRIRCERSRSIRGSCSVHCYQPMLFVGLGGTGCRVGAELERRMRAELRGPCETGFQYNWAREGYQLPSCLQFLYADLSEGEDDWLRSSYGPGGDFLAPALSAWQATPEDRWNRLPAAVESAHRLIRLRSCRLVTVSEATMALAESIPFVAPRPSTKPVRVLADFKSGGSTLVPCPRSQVPRERLPADSLWLSWSCGESAATVVARAWSPVVVLPRGAGRQLRPSLSSSVSAVQLSFWVHIRPRECAGGATTASRCSFVAFSVAGGTGGGIGVRFTLPRPVTEQHEPALATSSGADDGSIRRAAAPRSCRATALSSAGPGTARMPARPCRVRGPVVPGRHGTRKSPVGRDRRPVSCLVRAVDRHVAAR